MAAGTPVASWSTTSLRRGMHVTAAGRDRGAGELDSRGTTVPHEIMALPDATRLDRLLGAVDVVVNCAGPFADTALDVVRAANRAGVLYLAPL